MKKTGLPFDATIEEMIAGYRTDIQGFGCLFCEHTTENGIIYKVNEQFMDADRAMREHIRSAHGNVFDCLISMDKQITGLSEHQAALMKLFYEGKSDLEVMQALGIGSASTVRNHRAQMKDREQQAKILLALMTLLKDSGKKTIRYVEPHAAATMLDDRYRVTPEEEADMLKKYFPAGLDGRILNFSMREKAKIVVLRQLTKRFRPDVVYSEKQVNEVLKTADDDFATLRRYMIEYGFMKRTPDGREYRLNVLASDFRVANETVLGTERPVSKKSARRSIEQIMPVAGVYTIKNMTNGKMFVCATLNLKTMDSKRFQLKQGLFQNAELQSDWQALGESSFTFDVLESLQTPSDGTSQTEQLYEMEKKWLTQLQPYGEKGYNKFAQK